MNAMREPTATGGGVCQAAESMFSYHCGACEALGQDRADKQTGEQRLLRTQVARGGRDGRLLGERAGQRQHEHHGQEAAQQHAQAP